MFIHRCLTSFRSLDAKKQYVLPPPIYCFICCAERGVRGNQLLLPLRMSPIKLSLLGLPLFLNLVLLLTLEETIEAPGVVDNRISNHSHLSNRFFFSTGLDPNQKYRFRCRRRSEVQIYSFQPSMSEVVVLDQFLLA